MRGLTLVMRLHLEKFRYGAVLQYDTASGRFWRGSPLVPQCNEVAIAAKESNAGMRLFTVVLADRSDGMAVKPVERLQQVHGGVAARLSGLPACLPEAVFTAAR
jgi:hypothetical protein